MNWTRWKSEIDAAVADTCIQIIKEPLSYFSEADVQQLLVEELRKIKPLGKSYPTSVKKGKGSKSLYTTSLIHREYAAGKGRRLDVAIMAPDDVKRIDGVNLTVKGDYLVPAYAFELGTEKTSDTADHFLNDCEKLEYATKKDDKVGYLIHFYKDVTQAKTGTKSRDKTEAKILKEFKQVFNTMNVKGITNVKILAILLRTYRNQTKMRGKCEIFDGDQWVKTNISRESRLREAILNQLT